MFVLIQLVPTVLLSDDPVTRGIVTLPYWTLVVVISFRFGLLTVVVAHFMLYFLSQMPINTDFTAWYSGHMIAAFAGLIALAGWAFHTSLGGQKLFAGNLLDE